MGKNVFRPMEIQYLVKKVEIAAPVFEADSDTEELDQLNEIDEYLGPTADELRQEAENFKKHWEKEKEEMIAKATSEAEAIKEEALTSSSQESKETIDDANIQAEKVSQDAATILAEAKTEAERIIQEAKDETEKIRGEARDEGISIGQEEGFQNGAVEVERLIGSVHKVLDAAIDKREDIIIEAENQMIELVLLISKKVIKVISEDQKDIVIRNIIDALQKMKNRGDVEIRVNLEDAELTTQHAQDFIDKIESVSSIKVLEDSSIGKGGCIIETNLGRIDGRISSQLREIEDRIRDLMPIKVERDKKGLEEYGL